MQTLRIDSRSPYRTLIGVGGIGTGCFFALEGEQTLGRNESRPGRLLDVRDYCKLHIISHYVSKLLGAGKSDFQVFPIGRVGADAPGRQVMEEMAGVGMDTQFVHSSEGKPTLFSVCFQYPDGCGGNITTSNSAAAEVCEADVDAAREILVSQGKTAIALAAPEVPLEARRRLLDRATETRAFRVASFVASEITAAREMGMFERLDLVSLNESEASQLVGHPFSPEATENFVRSCQDFVRKRLPKLQMVLSVGSLGAYGISSDVWNFCPAPKVNVASTAGAGDALLGGILTGFAAGLPLLKSDKREGVVETALDIGVLLGSYKCQSPHTIHPDADFAALLSFAGMHGLKLGSGLEELLS